MLIILQPALMVPEPVKEKLDCDEIEALVQQCEQWSRELVSSYPHRKVMNYSFLQFIYNNINCLIRI